MKKEIKKSFLFTVVLSLILGAVSCVFGIFMQTPKMPTAYAAETEEETTSTEDEIMPLADTSNAYMVPIQMVLTQMGSSAIALSGIYINTVLPEGYSDLTPTEITATSGVVPVHCYLYGRALYVVSSEDPANKVYAYFASPSYSSSFFSGASGATTIDVSNLDLSELPNFDYMFQNCKSLSTLIFPETMNTLQATSMNNMFPSNPALTEVNLSVFDMINVTSATDMLKGLTNVKLLQTPTNINIDVALPYVMYARDENGNIVEYDNLYEDITDTSTSITLKARYAVNFDGNGSEDTLEPSYFLYNETSATLPADTLTRDGYTFTGWNTEANGSGTTYSANDTLSSLANENITLYAQWEAVPATEATISSTNSTSGQVYNSIDGTISVEATAVDGHSLSYQWYSSETNSNSEGVLIDGATEATYALPTNLTAGTHYYYCEVTSTYDANGETAVVTSDVITVEIEPIQLIVLIDSYNSVYGEELKSLTSTLINGTILEGDENVYEIVCDISSASGAGKYEITGNVLNTNYAITFINGTYEITPKDMTLTWSNTTTTYNGQNQYPTATSEDFINRENTLITVSEFKDAGTYLATASLPENIAKNYNILNSTQVFTINQILIDLTWVNYQLTYNGEEQLPEVTYYNVLEADEETFEIYFSGAQINAGNYIAMATGVSNPNYKLPGNVTCLYEIKPIYVHVRIHDQYATYGDEILSEDKLTYEFVSGEEDIIETDKPLFGISTGAFNGCDAGQYDISIIWTQANYDIHCEDGTYYVDSREITVQIDSVESEWGKQMPEFTASLTEGELLEGDSLENIFILELDIDYITEFYPVSSYNIMPYPLTENYDITYNYDAIYTVTPRKLVVRVDDKESVYGTTLEKMLNNLSANLTEGSILEQDGAVYRLCIADIDENTQYLNKGEYTITCETLNNNYEIEFNAAKYTITPREIYLTIEDSTSVYGEEIVLNYGLSENSTFDVLAQDGTIDSICQVGISNASGLLNADEYEITIEGLNDNYIVKYDNLIAPKLTIAKKEVTVAWGENTSFTYNGQAQAPTATAEDFDILVEGTKTNVGTYTATAKLLNVDENNYQFINETKQFEIVAKNFEGNASVLSIAELTYIGSALTPMVNVVDSELGALMINVDYSVEYTNNTDAGIATVTISGLSNFSGELTQTFTINKKELVVNWSNLTFIYNGAQHKPVATVDGNLFNLIVTGSATDIGMYIATATLSNQDAKNYRLTNATTQFVITATETENPEQPEEPTTTSSDDEEDEITKWIALGVAGVAIVWLIGLSCVVVKNKKSLDTSVFVPALAPEKVDTPKKRIRQTVTSISKKTTAKKDTTKKASTKTKASTGRTKTTKK